MFRKQWLLAVCALSLAATVVGSPAMPGESVHMVRQARLIIDSAQLEPYKAALKEEIETSLRLEPGVLMLYAVSENERPEHITILEIYESHEAYQRHIQSPHFLKYKAATAQMVKSLELVDVTPLVPTARTR